MRPFERYEPGLRTQCDLDCIGEDVRAGTDTGQRGIVEDNLFSRHFPNQRA
jgi:hypothetical protein